jgi:hypothetical protein
MEDQRRVGDQAAMPIELLDEAIWLRHRIIRLRAALRFAENSKVQAILRELIAEAESRIAAVEENEACRLGSALWG